MRNIVLAALVVVFASAAPLCAESGFGLQRASPRMFEATLLPLDADLRGQLMDESGAQSKDQYFGAGVALGFAGDPIGFGLAGWFDYYLTTWLAVGARFQMGYGIVTRRFEDGGVGLDFSMQFGAKFVFDMPDWEWSRWCRPFVALYPAGFRYASATEEAKDRSGRDFDFSYGDVFYVITAGGGVDFFLTSNIAVGAAVYFDGTVGGSKHKEKGVTIRHRGAFDFFLEYARLSVRF
ncbi:MAG: hypothetical protein KF754_13365 [Planctomycetes bacterium]|nr:hypothetical protein [Planctomycetota bacterium]